MQVNQHILNTALWGALCGLTATLQSYCSISGRTSDTGIFCLVSVNIYLLFHLYMSCSAAHRINTPFNCFHACVAFFLSGNSVFLMSAAPRSAVPLFSLQTFAFSYHSPVPAVLDGSVSFIFTYCMPCTRRTACFSEPAVLLLRTIFSKVTMCTWIHLCFFQALSFWILFSFLKFLHRSLFHSNL